MNLPITSEISLSDEKMKYAVHLYPTVRVKVIGIEANSIAKAVEKAYAAVNLHDALDNPFPHAASVEFVEWDEGATNFVLVDPLDAAGEVIYDKSIWVDGITGEPLINGRTVAEQKAVAYDDSSKFMTELLESVETLTEIAEKHGARTLADLFYLQQAILNSGFIDHYPDESKVLEIANALPSCEQWLKYIKIEYMVQ